MIPPRSFIRRCQEAGGRYKVADSTGAELSGRKLLLGALLFRKLLRSNALAPDEKQVGILLPPAAGAAVTNAALALDQRVAVNLNYTLSDDVINHCIREAGIKHVITSRAFMLKRPVKFEAEAVYLEDLRKQASKLDQALALAKSYLPAPLLERKLGLHKVSDDELLTIIFTSGSTGQPKGVMLSHGNIAANIKSIEQLVELHDDDTMLGVLPFFHAFGYTATLWWPLCLNTRAAYHYNPLDARTVGKLCQKYHGTLLVATPTFLRSYLKRCTKEQLGTLDVAIVGAEKLPADLRTAFTEKFGVEPSEGYGATELAPIASCNIPDGRALDKSRSATRHGTVGPPLPGQHAKVVDPDDGHDLETDQEGLLLISGGNVMKGYWHQPEKTGEVIRDGWYMTGDMARIDADGFIHITGRQSRFSKIGGEMVPHIRIEEELHAILGDEESESATVAVTAVPDEKKGERIIVLHAPLQKSTEEILASLNERGLPNLWLPDRDAFCEVEEIPVLGSGKLDLRAVKELALNRYAAPSKS
ncbi:AMP-binding protein [Calycomorphotria hydatis]|uniref:Bifunctional protein Aas n=1 Tax=Calycomorphotria hydatis TaxID=2528027 RepID=A0A517TAS0_9PLAN|nr:AMP-binding protein [Calycomorphotria hydatis]QDT65465.1 Bifunctional protein Aas [Calycomorphotria hydatis]